MLKIIKKIFFISLLFYHTHLSAFSFLEKLAGFQNLVYNESSIDSFLVANPKEAEIFKIFYLFHDQRARVFDKEEAREELMEAMENCLEKLEDNEFNLDRDENLFLLGVFNGLRAFLSLESAFFSTTSYAVDALEYFEKLPKNSLLDFELGEGCANYYLSLYFSDSFWVDKVLGYQGDILKAEKILEQILHKGTITSIEAGLILIEYNGEILRNYEKALTYLEIIIKKYPASNYFKYLKTKYLYQNYQFEKCLASIRQLKPRLNYDKFYPYYIDIYKDEAMIYLFKNDLKTAQEIILFLQKIHDSREFLGEIYGLYNTLDNSNFFKKEEIIYQNKNQLKRELLDIFQGEIKSLNEAYSFNKYLEILFNKRDFNSLKELFLKSKRENEQIKILHYLALLYYSEKNYQLAKTTITELFDKYDDQIEDYYDRRRIEILKNILLSFLKED